ncbi:GldG family protein [Pseudomarimonas salicorniae]|uniref:Gldg family protein n=1 Tax=Pseudomarimonas salicorniae TaxID=2933270 RepID=A0ABT0GL21_9GAMM|nr:Gldg family protein [Lysobacter sp. CAU 1642]MCK7594929.1 Gldg family protein [Lysobacter sp. CAU 1642]
MNLLTRRTLTGTTLVVLGLLFIAAVVLSAALLRGLRLDLTENRLYTLSEGTRAIIERIEEPLQLTFYFSESATKNIPQLRTYANRVRELLEEIAAESRGTIKLEVIDPQPFSEEEDRATAFGLQAVPLGQGAGSLFFGLAGSNSTDGQMAIPFFQPDKEAFLEYDIAKLISGLSGEDKPVVGVISTLDIGPGFDPATRRVTDGVVVYTEMRNLFDVKRIEPTATSIEEDVQLLMLVHPKGLSSDTLYAIDQFVLRGGRLLVFVDPHAEMEQAGQGADPTQAMFESKSSDLAPLFKAWGVKYDPDRVVLDAQAALQIQTQPDQPPTRHLGILGLEPSQLNQDDVISAELGTVNLSSVGYFEPAEGATTTLQALAQTSASSMTVGSERIRFLPDPEQLFTDFSPDGQRHMLAARLGGKLKTAFPDRSGEGHLAESEGEAAIVLVADTDLLADRMWVQVQQFFGQKVMNAFADNGNFVINAVDNLTGSTDLIKVRTRPTSNRPFTTVEALRRQADDRFRTKEQELQAELTETEQRLTELQSARDDQGSTLLTAEQSAELQRFQDQKLRIRKELRQVRRQLDADIQSLGARLKFINIVGVPLLVTLVAVGFAFWRARRRKEAAA